MLINSEAKFRKTMMERIPLFQSPQKLGRWMACSCAAASLLALSGCCSSNPSNNTTTCSITFQNSPGPAASPTCTSTQGTVSGYVVFTGAVSITRGANVVVQWSTDSFATTTYTGAGVVNTQGMVAVPFGFNVTFCSSIALQIRAFQDPNFTGTWSAGQAEGRYDGTDYGNTSFTTVNLNTSQATQGNVIIFLDGTAAQ